MFCLTIQKVESHVFNSLGAGVKGHKFLLLIFAIKNNRASVKTVITHTRPLDSYTLYKDSVFIFQTNRASPSTSVRFAN